MGQAVIQNVAIVGAGAIGGWLGLQLARAGCVVSVLARGDMLAAVQRAGLQLRSGASSVPVRVSDRASELGLSRLQAQTLGLYPG